MSNAPIDRAVTKDWYRGARVLERDGRGPKVYESPDGEQILKLFRARRWWSSNLWKPYARRFVLNASQLQRLGVNTVSVVSWGDVAQSQYVLYEKLPGQILRHASPFRAAALGDFMASLHEKGVYFRSCHLGNILVTGGDTLALIDVGDIRFLDRPLGVRQRCRNWRHFMRYRLDRQLLGTHREAFWSAYRARCVLSASECDLLRDAFDGALITAPCTA